MKHVIGILAAAIVLMGVAAAQAQTSTHIGSLRAPSNSGAAGEIAVYQDDTGTVKGQTTLEGLTSLTLGSSGTALLQIRAYSSTVTPGSVPANGCNWQTFTVSGLTTADKVFINPPSLWTPAAVNQLVSAADLLAINFCNPGNVAASPAGGAVKVIAIRS